MGLIIGIRKNALGAQCYLRILKTHPQAIRTAYIKRLTFGSIYEEVNLTSTFSTTL